MIETEFTYSAPDSKGHELHTDSKYLFMSIPLVDEDVFHPTYFARFELDFDAVGVFGRFGEQALYDTFSEFARALVMLLHDLYCCSYLYICSDGSVGHRTKVG